MKPAHREPESVEEYRTLLEQRNYAVTDLCTGAMVAHLACPFCVAPDFLKVPAEDVSRPMLFFALCMTCKRSAAVAWSRDGTFRIMQYSGSEPAPWARQERLQRR